MNGTPRAIGPIADQVLPWIAQARAVQREAREHEGASTPPAREQPRPHALPDRQLRDEARGEVEPEILEIRAHL